MSISILKWKTSITAVAVALIWSATAAYADDNTYDTRSLAMGGTGVATSNTGNAAFENPSMLASTQKDSFAWQIPVISARLQDENNLHSDINSLKTTANNLSSAIQTFQANPTQATAGAAGVAIANFNNSLVSADNKSLMADLFAGTMLGVSRKNIAFAVYLDERVEAGVMFNYAPGDKGTINTIATAFSNCAANAANCNASATTVNGLTTNGKINNLQSQVLIRGVRTKDVGISAAHHFDFLGGVDLGITPKISQLTTYDFSVGAQSPSLSLNQGEKGYSTFNMDVGGSKSFKTGGENEIKTGIAIKNMLSKSFITVLGDSINIRPQAAVGVSYVTKLTTAGVDLDVIPNKPIISAFSKESQYLRLGAEFDAWRWAQVRIGWRHDLKGNYPNLPSIGFGFSPFGVHIDISAAYANQKEAAASLQMGVNF